MKYLIVLFVLMGSMPLLAQDRSQTEGKILGTFRFTRDSIQLRWSPDSPRLWLLANKYGYVIDRITTKKAEKSHRAPVRLLTPQALKPFSLDQWERLSGRIEKASVVAQAIYGETFSLTNKGQGTSVGRAIQESEEREQKFGFSALVADQYYEVAKAAGLGFTDKDVKTDEVYVYRIYSPIPPKERFKSDTAYIRADFNRQQAIIAPGGMEGSFGDRSIQLKWDSENAPNYFSGYFIEQSEDGKNYKILNKEPVVYFQSDAAAGQAFGNKVIRNDSLPANNVTYYYRVRGMTPFGELSPPTAAVKGMGRDALKDTPVITMAGVQKNDSKIQVNWTFPIEKNKLIKHFQVRRSATIINGVVPTDSTLARVPAITRRFIDPKPISTAYYQIVAIGLQDEELLSYATVMELPDSIPPATPLDLKGKIDTSGIVRLIWRNNTERDFLGYRVFRSNLADGLFMQVTHTPQLTPDFTDTIDVETTTKYVYYKLVAIDQRANPSEFSETLRLTRPDKYPPVLPYLNSFEVKARQVNLSWVNSPSEDLDSTTLFRRERGSIRWSKLISFSKSSRTTFTDTTGVSGKNYEYRMMAKDESGKISIDDKKYLLVHWLEMKVRDAPKLTLQKQKGYILLTWALLPKIKKILIFRKTDTIPLKVFKTIWGDKQNSLEDKAVSPGNVYSYFLKIVFDDNTESFFSPEATLIYE